MCFPHSHIQCTHFRLPISKDLPHLSADVNTPKRKGEIKRETVVTQVLSSKELFPQKAFGRLPYYFPKFCFPLVQSVLLTLAVREFHV